MNGLPLFDVNSDNPLQAAIARDRANTLPIKCDGCGGFFICQPDCAYNLPTWLEPR